MLWEFTCAQDRRFQLISKMFPASILLSARAVKIRMEIRQALRTCRIHIVDNGSVSTYIKEISLIKPRGILLKFESKSGHCSFPSGDEKTTVE